MRCTCGLRMREGGEGGREGGRGREGQRGARYSIVL